MEKGQKIIVLVSVAIIGITAVVIAAISPYAFEEQCKQKTREMLNNLYSIEGGKDEFLRSNDHGLLSDEGKRNLQNLKNVISQCPILKSMPEEQLGIDIFALNIYNVLPSSIRDIKSYHLDEYWYALSH